MGTERYIPKTRNVLAVDAPTARRLVTALIDVGLEHDATHHQLIQAAMDAGLSDTSAEQLVDALIAIR